MSGFSPTAPCPCGSNQTYGNCCGMYHAGLRDAETAEKLMRSRYCAFYLRDGAYLTRTLAEEKRPGFDGNTVAQGTTQWSGLEIVDRVAGGVLDQTGIVEFIASFVEQGQTGQLHERSNFERRGGKWVYVDGIFPEAASHHEIAERPFVHGATTKAGRNDPCPCGSGKKFKKCCG
ncbi:MULTISPECIES: YchJ family protein [Thalassospira]|uniref:SecC motif-containing protein n=2 Tax=Thalassospira TaxID=168934 RepID=A0A367VZ27_9PROT|nr:MULTISPECIES: YchJ family protein [Thalassospira]MDG4721674.1 YchJ family protein [Thalassospira sp. FZY0004]RCK31392.1 SecC motif-containing protein [Thalassospira profundimaris]